VGAFFVAILDVNAISTVLMDVEGTTTRVQFVFEVLFPYAQANLAAYLATHAADTQLQAVLQQIAAEQPNNPVEHTLRQWMAQDVKHPLLKQIQGWLWQAGYEAGQLDGHVYADVPLAFQQWQGLGKRLAIYSSGSVLAQQLLFRHSVAGDLCPYLEAHFDTGVGAKQQPSSYQHIASHLNEPPHAILFLSDVAEELTAAKHAGMQVAQIYRPDHPRFIPGDDMPVFPDFLAIDLTPNALEPE
jgi:enolase-phosphatase E1